jgi:hypothetical protein
MKQNYFYTVNGQTVNTQREVNSTIRKMNEKPIVIKFETWSNGKTSKRVIKVKGSVEKKNLTIL